MPRSLVFPTDALKGLAIVFDTDEFARLGVSFDPVSRLGVVNLRSLTHLALSITVTSVPTHCYSSDIELRWLNWYDYHT